MSFVCEFQLQPASNEYTLTKDMLGDSVNFLMRVKEVQPEILQKRESMPGFRISWKVEGLQLRDMEVEVGEVGRRVESPGWGQPWEESWWRENHTFKVSLLMEQVVERMEAGDTFVVEVEVDRGEGEVLVGRGGPTA